MTAAAIDAIVLIVSAASGTGKSSLTRALVQSEPNTELSISFTTRELRTGEEDGRDYHFISVDLFKEMIEEDQFVEWAEVYGCYYGTAKSAIESKLASGVSVVLDIDWQGAMEVMKKLDDATSIFLLPPSIDSLKQRLVGRGRDSRETIDQRFKAAEKDMKNFYKYDYVILNDNFDDALEDIRKVLRGQGDKIRLLPGGLFEELGLNES